MPRASWTVEVNWSNDGTTWVDETSRTMKVMIERGTPDQLTRTAPPAKCTLLLRNADKRFSPGYTGGALGTNVKNGRRIRVRTTAPSAVTKFDGRIDELHPEPGLKGPRTLTLIAFDDMQRLARNDVTLAMQVNQRSDQIVANIIANVYTPASTDYGVGDDTYGYVGDTWVYKQDKASVFTPDPQHQSNPFHPGPPLVTNPTGSGGKEYQLQGNALPALQNVVQSEFGRLWYSTANAPTFRSRSYFETTTTIAVTFSDNMAGLTVLYPSDLIANDVRVTCYPRTLAAAVEVLWKLDKPDPIDAGQARTYRATFADPSNPDVRVGGTGMVTPVANTDFKFNESADGHGGDLTAGIVISGVTFFSNYCEFTLTNNGTRNGFVTRAQVRGQKITQYNPYIARLIDSASQTTYNGARPLPYDMPDQDSKLKADDLANFLLYDRKDQHEQLSGLLLRPNTAALLTHMLTRVQGEQVTVIESQTAVSANYWIVGSREEVTDGMSRYEVVLDLERSHAGEFWLLGVAGHGELDTTARLGF